MNYKKLYDAICARAKVRNSLEGYVEKHHIVPRSLGGTDDEENIVVLTAREHFLVHRLLARATDNPKMWMAFNYMAHTGRVLHKFKCAPWASKNYEKERLACALVFSEMSRGENNPMFGKPRPDLAEYNRTRVNPLKGRSGAFSKTSKPLCVEFMDGSVVFTEVGAQEFARSNNIPLGTMSYCLSTGASMLKHNIKRAWRP